MISCDLCSNRSNLSDLKQAGNSNSYDAVKNALAEHEEIRDVCQDCLRGLIQPAISEIVRAEAPALAEKVKARIMIMKLKDERPTNQGANVQTQGL